MPGASTSITRSGGDGLVVETTSVSVLAWVEGSKAGAPYQGNAAAAVQWLRSRCEVPQWASVV